MSIQSPDFAPAQQPPFPVEQMPAGVFDTADDDEIATMLTERLEADGIDMTQVVFSGFDAGQVIRNGSFGDRTATFAVGAEMLNSDDSKRSPIAYLVDNAEFAPAIGVFNISDMVGSSAEDPIELMNPVTPDDLKARPDDFIFWRTKDGESLDAAAVKLFVF